MRETSSRMHCEKFVRGINFCWWDTSSCRTTCICLPASRRRPPIGGAKGVEAGLLAGPAENRRRVSAAQLRLPFTSGGGHLPRFWQPRFYDFKVYSRRKKRERLEHRNANSVNRGLLTGKVIRKHIRESVAILGLFLGDVAANAAGLDPTPLKFLHQIPCARSVRGKCRFPDFERDRRFYSRVNA